MVGILVSFWEKAYFQVSFRCYLYQIERSTCPILFCWLRWIPTDFLQSTRSVGAIVGSQMIDFIIRYGPMGPAPFRFPIFFVFSSSSSKFFFAFFFLPLRKKRFPFHISHHLLFSRFTKHLPCRCFQELFYRNFNVSTCFNHPKVTYATTTFFFVQWYGWHLYVSWSDPQVADHLTDESAHELSEENLEVRNKQSLAMFQTLGGYIKIHQSFNDLSQIFGGENFLGIQT